MYTGIHTCLCMTTKNLAIREEVYRKLAEAKHEGESFSDVIERMIEKRSSLLPLWGALAQSESIAEIQRDLRNLRKTARIRS